MRHLGLAVRPLTEARHRDQTPGLRTEPAPPMRALCVADVRDRACPELRRARHAPTHHPKITLAITDAHHGREPVGEDGWKWRRLPALSRETRNSRRMASCERVTEER